ncbi:MAG: hypothetical protein CVU84_12265 [Firmicutes bacterium HGW-Firmicutes-1]|jgi:hypothetical protein|nr:MAG: hypothetical protein CVU84_12265 [Firmicutes bacterium HGW-Firmicutes-1]
MEQSTWYLELIDKIEAVTNGFSEKETKKYQINWLKKLLVKVDLFQSSCTECCELKTEVETLLTELSFIKTQSNHDTTQYFKIMDTIYKHLKTRHKIVEIRHYVNFGVIIGVVLGIIVSITLKNYIPGALKYGMYVSVLAGFVIGLYLDKKAVTENRVI